MTVYAVRQGSCVNNFVIETAEINIEVKHHLINIYSKTAKIQETRPHVDKYDNSHGCVPARICAPQGFRMPLRIFVSGARQTRWRNIRF